MVLQQDQNGQKPFQLYLPMDTLKNCCHLDTGQSLQLVGNGHRKGSDFESIKLIIARHQECIGFEIEAPTLESLFTESGYVITIASKYTALGSPNVYQTETSTNLTSTSNNSLNAVTIENDIGQRCDDSKGVQMKENIITHEICTESSKVPANNLLMKRVTRSMKKSLCHSVPLRTRADEKSSKRHNDKKDNLLANNDYIRESHIDLMSVDKADCSRSSVYDAKEECCKSDSEASSNESSSRCVGLDCPTHTQSKCHVTSTKLECLTGRCSPEGGIQQMLHSYIVTNGKCTSNDNFHCDLCSRSFSNIQQLNRHKAMKHAKFVHPNPLRCRYCENKFKNAHERRLHQFYRCSQNSNISEPNICQICNKPFQTKNQLVAHMQRAHRSKVKMSCIKCGALFSNQGGLRGHVITVHHTKTVHKCHVCEKVFPGLSALQRHLTTASCTATDLNKASTSAVTNGKLPRSQGKVNTENNQSILCPKCGRCFKTQRAVSSHVGAAHGKEWPYRCERCDRVFRLKKKLDSHVCAVGGEVSQRRSTRGNKRDQASDTSNIPCPLCDVYKINYDSLYKHLLSCHKGHAKYEEALAKLKPLMRVQCDRCGLDFSTTTNLRKHMKIRKCTNNQLAGMKSGQPCPFCTKISASMTHLAQHMQLMHKEHPRYQEEEQKLHAVLTVQCEICGNWYPDKGSWQQHYTNAHAKDRHRCPYCRKPFRLESHMQVHMNHRHLGLPYKKSTRRYFRVCKYCPKSFLTKNELEEHTKLEHSIKRQVHQCDKCSFMYSETKQYFLHHRKVHSGRTIQCFGCRLSFTSVWFLKKHLKGCAKARNTSAKHRNSPRCTKIQVSVAELKDSSVQHLEDTKDYSMQNTELKPSAVGEKVIHVIPVLTPESVHSYAQVSKQPTENSFQLSDVFTDCVITEEGVAVSQVSEVTIDGNTQIIEGSAPGGFEASKVTGSGDFHVTEDSEVTSEQVVYLPAGTSLNISQLPLGTVIETSDHTTYWSGT